MMLLLLLLLLPSELACLALQMSSVYLYKGVFCVLDVVKQKHKLQEREIKGIKSLISDKK